MIDVTPEQLKIILGMVSQFFPDCEVRGLVHALTVQKSTIPTLIWRLSDKLCLIGDDLQS